MIKSKRTQLAVLYDNQTGRIVLSHRAVVLGKSREPSEKQLLAEAASLAKKSGLRLPAHWAGLWLEMSREKAGKLAAINPKTTHPTFWDIKNKARRKAK
jgi:hypothetical protein